jgi:transposase
LEWAEVRTLAASGVSQHEIARRLGINRRTVKRLIESDEPPRYRRTATGSMLDPLEPVLRALLEDWPDIKAPRVTEVLRVDHGYSGSVDLVRRRLQELRPTTARPAQRTGYRPGQVLQLDWAEMPTRPKIGGRERRVYALIGSLPYSGAQSAHFSFDMTAESFLEGHTRLFDWLGGVPSECVYDNLRTVVAKRDKDEVRWNPRFLHLRGHYAFHATACTPATPREKGSVEGSVRYVKTGFWPADRLAAGPRRAIRRLARRRLQPAPARDRSLRRRRSLGRGARAPAAAATGPLRLRLRAREPRPTRRLPSLRAKLLPRAGGARPPARRAARRPRHRLDLTPRRRGRRLPAQLRARQLVARAEAAA